MFEEGEGPIKYIKDGEDLLIVDPHQVTWLCHRWNIKAGHARACYDLTQSK